MKLLALVAVFAALALVPVATGSDAWIKIATLAVFAALMGQAWNVAGGYGGLFSFGHALFFGIGAYGVAVMQLQFGLNPWLGFLAGAGLAALMAVIVGFLAARYGLRGSYFALVTLAFAEVFRILSNSVSWTGAGEGLLIPLDRQPANLQFAEAASWYWLALALAFIAFLTVWAMERSRFGAQLTAVRDNEDAAAAIGVNAMAVKLKAMALSGCFMGFAGAFYAQNFLYLDPIIAFGPEKSVEALLVAIIGGMGTLFGPLLGAFALHGLAEFAREVLGASDAIRLVIYGGLLVVMVVFLPRGIAGLGRVRRRRARG